jgi:hypothetical protein
MGFGLIYIGNSCLRPLPYFVDTQPPIFFYVHMHLVIHFIHYISIYIIYVLPLIHTSHLQYTSLVSRPHTTFTIHITSLGFENGDVTRTNGKNMAAFNSVFIALIPKIDKPTRYEQFRPISL